MVRSTRRNNKNKSSSIKRRSSRSGGGWAQGPALTKNAYYVPEYISTADCYDMARPGSIQSNPNPNLAQTPMAGGRSRKSRRQNGGSCGCGLMRGGSRSSARSSGGGCGCGLMRGGGGYIRSGGACPYAKQGGACPYAKVGGKRMRKTKRAQKGGRYGMDVADSVGGTGPVMAPVFAHVPCEAHRPMPLNPTLPSGFVQIPDPDVNVDGLKPAFIQAGGGGGNQHPLAYYAPRASFGFTPNIAQGATLNPGQIPYQEVVSVQDNCAGATCSTAIATINK